MGSEPAQPKKNAIPKLELEQGTVMMTKFSRSADTMKARYIGMEKGAFIILRYPSGVGIHDHLYEGNDVVVKFISNGTVYGFQSKVLGYMYKKGLILVVLHYPQSLETHLLRNETRVDYVAPAEISVGGTKIQGFTQDISLSGGRFSYEVSPEVPEFDFNEIRDISLSLQVIGLEGARQVSCEVKSATPEGSFVSLGLKFTDMDEETAQALGQYINQVALFLH